MPLLEEVDVSRACIVGRLYSAGGAFALERPPADRPCVRFVSSSMWRVQESLRINAFLCMAVFDSYAGRGPRRSIRSASGKRRFLDADFPNATWMHLSLARARDYFYVQDVEINVTRKYAISNNKDLARSSRDWRHSKNTNAPRHWDIREKRAVENISQFRKRVLYIR